MKKTTIIFLIALQLFMTGCNEDEIIEIYESERSEYALNESVETGKIDELSNTESQQTNEAAEDIVEDAPRPFVVFVTGEVEEPGVYELKEGSRIIDAIDIAGGYTDGACEYYLNLAEFVTDEQMIYVPTEAEVCEMKEGLSNRLTEILDSENAKVGSSENISTGTSGDKINLNSATKEQLMSLPGVGEAKAEKIISFRETNGGFNKPEDIMQISGIKEKMYEKIKDGICVK